MSALYEVRLIAAGFAVASGDSARDAEAKAEAAANTGDLKVAKAVARQITEEEARELRMRADMVLA